MEWGIAVIGIIFVLAGYVVIQGTRAAMAWRKAAGAGDVDVIRRIVEQGIAGLRSGRRPKEAPPDVWRGLQSMEIVEVGPDLVWVSCQAESEYRLVDGNWIEVKDPLEEGMAITVRALDVILYDLPNYRPERVQVDVYTSFRGQDGANRRYCILSTKANRDEARHVDWDESAAADIIEELGGRYRLSPSGQPMPLDVPRNPRTSGGNGHVAPIGS